MIGPYFAVYGFPQLYTSFDVSLCPADLRADNLYVPGTVWRLDTKRAWACPAERRFCRCPEIGWLAAFFAECDTVTPLPGLKGWEAVKDGYTYRIPREWDVRYDYPTYAEDSRGSVVAYRPKNI